MFTKAMIPALAAALVAVAPAMADPDGGGQDDRPGYAYDGGSADGYDYARVTHVEPRYRQVRISVPRQECYTETRYVTDGRSYGRDGQTAGGTILGGLLGAVIGHQIGHGGGRAAGTVAGAIIGGAIGHDAAQRDADERGYAGYDEREVRPVERERCVTRYSDSLEQRIDGYRVSYRYNGRDYQTDLPYDPGEQLRVRVTVSPQGY
ncbi:MAG TPA: glycine zipper 2TM domain-containing protein [Steroidobacteraceae bacterium]|nr:glycine zipper 2TM domain-containing protein [Steroidobacteraceae bacterium]